MQIYEYSGEELEHVTGEIYVPVIARTGPNFRGRSAVQELGETRRFLERIGGRSRCSGPTEGRRERRQTT